VWWQVQDKMSAIVDYSDGALGIISAMEPEPVLLEPNYEGLGILDSILKK